jgi:ABC-type arginine transport system permease subunit
MRVVKIAAIAAPLALVAGSALAQTATTASTALTDIQEQVTDLIGVATPILVTIMLGYFGLKLLAKVADFVMKAGTKT